MSSNTYVKYALKNKMLTLSYISVYFWTNIKKIQMCYHVVIYAIIVIVIVTEVTNEVLVIVFLSTVGHLRTIILKQIALWQNVSEHNTHNFRRCIMPNGPKTCLHTNLRET